MSRIYSVEEILNSDDFRILTESPYKPVGMGYTARFGFDMEKEVLIAERQKADDSRRSGQFALPAGGVRGGETYMAAAQRETREETGIETNPGIVCFARLSEHPVLKPRDDAIAIVDWGGAVWVYYRDSGKRYYFQIFGLEPLYPSKKPKQTNTNAVNPRYVQLSYALSLRDWFTPACQIALEMIETIENDIPFIKPNDLLLDKSPGLKIMEPEK